MMTKLTAISVMLLATSFPSLAVAETCGSGRSAQSPAVKMLQRQLSALRSIQRARGCKPGDSSGGIFNACREVGMKISEVQQELRATAAANNECKAEARTGRKAKVPAKPKTVNVSAAGNARAQPVTAPKKVRGPKNALQYCVRLSDGYYFPTPNSQYKQKGGTDAALIQCKMICKTDAMAVYINDQNEEAAEMVSVQTGESYADLATAYDYHGEGEFKRCDWNGYVGKVSSLLAARSQSKRLADVEIPKPDVKPAEDPVAVAEIPAQQYRPAPDKAVRIVGPAFIPDADNKAFGHMRHHQH
ncbi:DUF2865 domain-containing protein [Ochrobactrum soli]|uniref:DUF2865 domain-containing protein n=1 Tax=Ochrobactrum soli TaxID=2448455 RepID=A0A849KSR6_9HYPH|nr:DUF2865 domain-containing protein [[Ochrobactrum] soli]NNU62980.1 DUF2865 domain-containing protein [[Ochrobactrum] soli]